MFAGTRQFKFSTWKICHRDHTHATITLQMIERSLEPGVPEKIQTYLLSCFSQHSIITHELNIILLLSFCDHDVISFCL